MDLLQHIFKNVSLSCNCSHSQLSTNENRTLSLTELAAAWFSENPRSYQQASELLKRHYKIKREDPDIQEFATIDFARFISQPPGQLYLSKSETLPTDSYQILTSYDIDSSIFLLTSLQACRSTIGITYNPAHLRTITSTLHFPVFLDNNRKIKNGDLHKLKNIRLGTFIEYEGVSINIFFPYMRIKRNGSNTLNQQERRAWIDDIILPAVKKTVPSDLLHHHPLSFDHILSKGLSRHEHSTSTSLPIDERVEMPESVLGHFWDQVVSNCNSYQTREDTVPDESFREPILLLSIHDTKIRARESTFQELIHTNFINFESKLNFAYIDEENSYQDIGIEHMPKLIRPKVDP